MKYLWAKFWPVPWAVAAAGLLLLHFWFPPVRGNIINDSYGVGGEGHKALYRLAEERFDWVYRNHRPYSRSIVPVQHQGGTWCILGPARLPREEEWEHLLDSVEKGLSLVLAIHEAEAFSIPRTDIRYVPTSPIEADDEAVKTDLVTGTQFWWYSAGELLGEQGEVLVEADETVQARRIPLGNGVIVVVATDEIFSNTALTYGENSALALRLLEAARDEPQHLCFDEWLNTTGTPQVVGLLFDETLRPITLQLLLITVLYGWWNQRRFGPLLPVSLRSRQNIVEHTDALGSRYWRSADPVVVLRNYLKMLVGELRLRQFKNQEHIVLEPIARRMGVPLEHVKTVLQTALTERKENHLTHRRVAHWLRELAPIRRAHHQHQG